MLCEMPAQRVDHLSALADEHLPRAKQHGAGLLIFRLHGDKAHGRAQRRLHDRLGVRHVVLLTLDEGLHINRWDQASEEGVTGPNVHI